MAKDTLYTPKGHTKATVELEQDAALSKKLRTIETSAGIETGVRFKEDGQYVVSVLFYPKTRFFIQRLNQDNTLDAPSDLSKEEYDQTWGLRL